MKRVLIVGGKLQGLEIAYLCRKAGYYSILLDKKQHTSAMKIVDEYVVGNALDDAIMTALISKVDVVIPALEDWAALKRLVYFTERMEKPLLFDIKAYNISSSKEKSNEIFRKLSLPIPEKFPNCSFPVIVKPDGLSGSAGVCKIDTPDDLRSLFESNRSDLVIEEFVEGPSYSLEVIGNGKEYIFPQITEIIVDGHYDCKRVVAPAKVSKEVESQFKKIGDTLSKKLKIKGIFDIEVILHNGILKILEIDARFPSQTPISVYHSTGLNMVKAMVEEDYSCEGFEKGNQVCLYQQIQVDQAGIAELGEHIMSDCVGIKIIEGFFGADVAMTDYIPGCKTFKSIIIITDQTEEHAYKKFEDVKQAILRSMFIKKLAV